MFALGLDSVHGWQNSGGLERPSAVNTICPECGERGTFTTRLDGEENKQKGDHLKCVLMRGTCPTCSFLARFVQVGRRGTPSWNLYIHPTPKLTRQPLPELDGSDIFTGRVRKAYVDSVHAYNVKHWSASAMMCGVALEGITKSLLPKELRKGSLAKQLRALPDHINLSKPISDLTDGIRRGRNIAAHFDEELEIDEPTAAKLIDLLESAIEYLFVLPDRIEKMDEQLRGLSDVSGD